MAVAIEITTQKVLCREIDTYENQIERLMRESHGKYAYIVGDNIIGMFETRSEALAADYGIYGDEGLVLRVGG